jgi:Domain of unknown function (DUF4124)
MHPKFTLLAFGCASLLAASAALAQIYKTTDAQGNVVFTDQPPADGGQAEQVELHPLNTTPATPVRPRPQPAKAADAPKAQYQVSIQAPANETTIPMGPGDFSVIAATQPPLAGGERLQLLLDGEQQGEPQAGGSWQLSNVFRGARQITVQRQSAEGKVLATSEPVTVYVHRPSVNFTNSNNSNFANRPNNN